MATTITIPTLARLMAITDQSTSRTASSSAPGHGSRATTGVAFTIADIMATDSMAAQATTTAEAGGTAIVANFVAGAGMDTPEEVIVAAAAFTKGVVITEAVTSTAADSTPEVVDSTADVGNRLNAQSAW